MPNLEIYKITFKPVARDEHPTLLAYCDFSVGPFRVHGTEVLREPNGRHVVRFARRPRPVTCRKCSNVIGMNHKFCRWCGKRQPEHEAERNGNGKPKVFRCYVHPVCSVDRRRIEDAIIRAWYESETSRPAPAPAPAGGGAPRLFCPSVAS